MSGAASAVFSILVPPCLSMDLTPQGAAPHFLILSLMLLFVHENSTKCLLSWVTAAPELPKTGPTWTEDALSVLGPEWDLGLWRDRGCQALLGTLLFQIMDSRW